MNKFKLSKQTIFTILGLVVIVASIPMAVILVNQRQEIRKEAVYSSETCGDFCASKVGHVDFPWCICNADRSPQSGYTESARTTTSDCTKSCVAYTSSSEDYEQAWGKPVWGLYQTGRTCSVTPPTPTPTTPPTPTPTGTVTPTPTTPPTPTPTDITSTPTPTTTTTTVAEATPSAELPEAGFALPTFGAVIGGILLILISLVFIL